MKMTRWELEAIETWLKQPKEPTPEERAKRIVERLTRLGIPPRADCVEAVTKEIQAAIDADRKERGS